jgi:hypothetical protein
MDRTPGMGAGAPGPARCVAADLGNKYVISGASYNCALLQGKTWSQVAVLHDPSSPIAQGADGAANYLTAAICKLTGNQPASACTPVGTSLEGKT